MKSLIDQLKEDEGFSPTPYLCTAQHWTIGYGLNLDAGINEHEADMLLRMRVEAIDNQLRETFPWFCHLDQARRDVIINMVYNLGLPRFKGFKRLIAALVIKDYITAAGEMLDSKWAVQVGDRAKRLAKVMRHE
jgi:lysozyme